ncbi:hypothetical protein JTB14_035356 [Gonioctena quinquepunctata]|nr:hypothetical protein JTB14_035356 [Gonioctena quinquepunctata]
MNLIKSPYSFHHIITYLAPVDAAPKSYKIRERYASVFPAWFRDIIKARYDELSRVRINCQLQSVRPRTQLKIPAEEAFNHGIESLKNREVHTRPVCVGAISERGNQAESHSEAI